MHFFDGFRTSHEIAKIRTIQYKDMERLMPYEELQVVFLTARRIASFSAVMLAWISHSDEI
jgi:pyruvate/2-oxoacid:ferredoxin oxidoreductase alpha subunit